MIDVIDRVLDKGIVIDYRARVSLPGIDLLTGIDARVIVASIDTYVHYAEQIRKTSTLAPLLPQASTLTSRAANRTLLRDGGRLGGRQARRSDQS